MIIGGVLAIVLGGFLVLNEVQHQADRRAQIKQQEQTPVASGADSYERGFNETFDTNGADAGSKITCDPNDPHYDEDDMAVCGGRGPDAAERKSREAAAEEKRENAAREREQAGQQEQQDARDEAEYDRLDCDAQLSDGLQGTAEETRCRELNILLGP